MLEFRWESLGDKHTTDRFPDSNIIDVLKLLKKFKSKERPLLSIQDIFFT
ncbi:hypothetical protein LKI01_09670 [Companilactobacillus paralimentarius]|nr:hypothetical protein LKI01_09670 [Companilactobacillus paralimentarius]